MKEVAQAIKVFPTKEEPPSIETAAVLVPLETLEAILKGLQDLTQEVKGLKWCGQELRSPGGDLPWPSS